MTGETPGASQAPADPAILKTLENCVSALAGTPECALLVTPLAAELVAHSQGPLFRASILTPDVAPAYIRTCSGLNATGAAAGKRFDTIVLDRCWDDAALRTALNDVWSSEQSMLRHMSTCLSENGRLLVIAAARRAQPLRRALKVIGFRSVEQFALVPHLSPMRHLVSTHPLAMRTFMLRAHGLPTAPPRNLLQWPRWLAVHLGADRIRISWYLFDAHL